MIKHVVHMIDTLSIGGAQKLLVTFGLEVQKQNITSEIICLSGNVDPQLGTSLFDARVKVTCYPADSLLSFSRLMKVINHLRKARPDVIQTHLTYANILGGIAGFFTRIPVVGTLHSAGQDRRYSKARDLLEKLVLRYLDKRIIAVGSSIAQAHKRRTGNRAVDIIVNAVPGPVNLSTEERTLIRESLPGVDGKTLLISVGRFSPVKAYEVMIHAFAKVQADDPNTALVLVGDGATRPAMENLAVETGLSKSVIFPGNRADVAKLLGASDIYVNSSNVEGVPLSVIEAMMAGLPIVATRVGDLPNMVGPDRGILVSPKDPDQLAQAIKALLLDENCRKQMGKKAQEYALKNFSTSVWITKILRIYESVGTA